MPVISTLIGAVAAGVATKILLARQLDSDWKQPPAVQLTAAVCTAIALAVVAGVANSPHLASIAVPAGLVTAWDLSARRIPFLVSGAAGVALFATTGLYLAGVEYSWVGLVFGILAATAITSSRLSNRVKDARATALAAPSACLIAGVVGWVANVSPVAVEGVVVAASCAAAVVFFALVFLWVKSRQGQRSSFGGGDAIWVPLCIMTAASPGDIHWVGVLMVIAWTGAVAGMFSVIWSASARLLVSSVNPVALDDTMAGQDATQEDPLPPYTAPGGPMFALGAAVAALIALL